MRSVLKDEGWRENKIGEGLVDDSKDGSQCLIYLFFILIDFCGFLNVRRRFKVGFELYSLFYGTPTNVQDE